MKKAPELYSLFQKVSAIIMIVALSWLTISAPFVFENQKKIAQQERPATADLPISGTEEEVNPLSGTTEEKAPKTLSAVSEEYLHDNHRSEYLFCITSQFQKAENASIYVAYHGEMLVPPPNKA
jgi:uncharacterized protein YecA (UPF0149 family)